MEHTVPLDASGSRPASLLKHLRLNLGFTQHEMAERIGIAPATYCILERGYPNPSVAVRTKLEAALGRPFHDLIAPFTVGGDPS